MSVLTSELSPTLEDLKLLGESQQEMMILGLISLEML